MNLPNYLKKTGTLVDRYLDRHLIKKNTHPKSIHEAIRYAVFSGGKRIRPVLTIAFAQAVGGRATSALPAASAIECIHAYSLVHDDLPCMDNDDTRRGKPTVHKKFDEATAVLTGDALLTKAFELTSRIKDPKMSRKVGNVLANAAGTRGMIGGQVVDKLFEGKRLTHPTMDYINIHKTGKLIAASCLTGAIMGGAKPNEERLALKYGEHLGLVFQLIDDIIDGDGYVRFAGKRECLHRAEILTQNAKKCISKFPKNQEVLTKIADFVFMRRK